MGCASGGLPTWAPPGSCALGAARERPRPAPHAHDGRLGHSAIGLCHVAVAIDCAMRRSRCGSLEVRVGVCDSAWRGGKGTTRSRCGDDGAIAGEVVTGRDRQLGSEVATVRKGNVQGGGCKAATVVLGVWGPRDLQHAVNPCGR